MPDASYVESHEHPIAAAAIPAGTKVVLLLGNLVPFFHVAAVIWIVAFTDVPAHLRTLFALAVLYLLPPLIAFPLSKVGRPIEGTIPLGDGRFVRWWLTFQLQGVFNRLPVLDEALRIVPGAYSMWLRLWGSHVGRMTFWGAGTRVLDRGLLQIGDDVVFGAGVRLNSHVLAKGADGELRLIAAPVRVESRCMIGGYALITAGSRICANEATDALAVMPPYTVFKDGKRVRNAPASEQGNG